MKSKTFREGDKVRVQAFHAAWDQQIDDAGYILETGDYHSFAVFIPALDDYFIYWAEDITLLVPAISCKLKIV